MLDIGRRSRGVDVHEHADAFAECAGNGDLHRVEHRDGYPAHVARGQRGKAGVQVGRQREEHRGDVVEIDLVATDDLTKKALRRTSYRGVIVGIDRDRPTDPSENANPRRIDGGLRNTFPHQLRVWRLQNER